MKVPPAFRPRCLWAIGLAGLAVCAFPAGAGAQGGKAVKAVKAEQAAPAEEKGGNGQDEGGKTPSGAAFMKELGRLSAILGSVHFLRTLCGDENAGLWREKMNEMIEAQAPNAADREILVAGFNGGWRAFESTYRKCTPAARLAVRRYQDEGAALAREVAARYGN